MIFFMRGSVECKICAASLAHVVKRNMLMKVTQGWIRIKKGWL